MLGQFTRQEEPDSGLDLPRSDGGTLVVVGQARSLSSDPLEDVIDKAVHDGHRLARDASVGMNLLENFVDVDPIALLPAPFLLLVPFRDVLLGLAGLLRSLPSRLRCHVSNEIQFSSIYLVRTGELTLRPV